MSDLAIERDVCAAHLRRPHRIDRRSGSPRRPDKLVQCPGRPEAQPDRPASLVPSTGGDVVLVRTKPHPNVPLVVHRANVLGRVFVVHCLDEVDVSVVCAVA